MKVRITVPAIAILARDEARKTKLAKLGFTIQSKKTKSGSEFLQCSDDLVVEMTLGKLLPLLKELKLVATIFPDGSISLEGA